MNRQSAVRSRRSPAIYWQISSRSATGAVEGWCHDINALSAHDWWQMNVQTDGHCHKSPFPLYGAGAWLLSQCLLTNFQRWWTKLLRTCPFWRRLFRRLKVSLSLEASTSRHRTSLKSHYLCSAGMQCLYRYALPILVYNAYNNVSHVADNRSVSSSSLMGLFSQV